MSKNQNKFQILKSLERDSRPTQRQLSNDLGVSLGKINYCLKSLIGKGFIKVNNFRNSNNKIQYSYLLTPKGIEEKAKLTLDFIRIKTQVYHYSNTGKVSWYDFAKEIFEISRIDCKVSPIITGQYPTPAKRPKNTLMNKDKIIGWFEAKSSNWEESLSACIIILKDKPCK